MRACSAVETVRMLVAEGRLAEVDGAYRLVSDIQTLAVPERADDRLGEASHE